MQTATNIPALNALEDGHISPMQIVVLMSCFLMNIADGFDILAMSYAAPAITSDLGIDGKRLGIVFSAVMIGMTVGSFGLAPLGDRFGRRPLILASLAITSVAMICTSQVDNLWQLSIFRFLTGIGIGCILPTLVPMVSEIFPRKLKSLAILFVVSGYGIGSVIAGPVTKFIVPEYGWPALFISGGVATGSLLLLGWFCVPESLEFAANNQRDPNRLKTVNRILKAFGRATLQALPDPPATGSEPSASVAALFSRTLLPTTLLLWSVAFMLYWAAYFMPNWTPTLFVASGFTGEAGINALTLFALGAVVGSLTLALLSAAWDTSKLLVASLVLNVATLGAVVFLGASSMFILSSLIFLSGFFTAGINGLYAVLGAAYPNRIRATGVGWGTGMGRIGAILSPVAVGMLVDEGWDMYQLFSAVIVPPLLLAAGILLVWRMFFSASTAEAAE